MCKNCILELFPNRGVVCLDEGHYLLNVKSCHQCGTRGKLRVENTTKTETEDTEDPGDQEYEEEVTFEHVCDVCNHRVAEHFYSFSVGIMDGQTVQNYTMACSLCGKGGDRRVVEGVNDMEQDAAEAPETKTSTTTPQLTTKRETGFIDSSLLDRASMQAKKSVDSNQDDEDSDGW